MSCPVCSQRKGRRECPALRQTICTVCCGTKRLTEIACPAECPYLVSAREHPAAVVRRQQEQDVTRLLPTIQHLTERQYQLFFVFHTAIAAHVPDGLVRLTDADVAEAAAAVAATLETAARGVLYEHAAATPPAQRLAGELRALLGRLRESGATVYDREAAIVLRAIEQGARSTVPGDETGYLALMARLLQVNRARQQQAGAAPAARPGSIVIP